MMSATTEGSAMLKKYIVRLTDAERATLMEVVKKLKGSSQKVRRAQILLKADVGGPGWTDAKAASKKYFQDFPYNVSRIWRTSAAELSSWQTLRCISARAPIAKVVQTTRIAIGMPTSTS
jgi:hypothetical protein